MIGKGNRVARRQIDRFTSRLVMAAILAVSLAVVGLGNARAQEGLSGPSEGESIGAWTERWMDGPVSLIAMSEEKAIYANLGTTQERLQFIRLFWEGRDPQTRGPRNEYLDEFAERLAYVEEKYANEREEAWETVFGHVVMLFGQPDRTRRELGSFGAGFSDRPPILWSYDDNIPGLEPNEDLVFVFRAGRWKLMPPYPIGDGAIQEAARDAERRSNVGVTIPSDYQRAMEEVVAATLVHAVDYRSAIDSVRTAVQLPEAQIPFSYTAELGDSEAGKTEVAIRMSWRMDSLIFHLVEGEFRTDMLIEAELLRDGEVQYAASERVNVAVPEAEMEQRREEIVQRTITLSAETGDYDLEIILLDQLLGYRTVYRDTIEVR